MSLLHYGNVYIEDGAIAEVGCAAYDADTVIDAKRKALVPGFVNTHTHAAMTLFRGYADDLPLQTWLQDWIWPAEAKLTGEDVYWGTKLACLEMIRTGTTTFNDMYWHALESAKAVDEMGIRTRIG
jgi:5-methylthioadenosine/S-adenosylhomocysteine deaminase